MPPRLPAAASNRTLCAISPILSLAPICVKIAAGGRRLQQGKSTEARTRGVKPKDLEERAACVAAAVRALEKIGATFTVADVAERAGLSRATIYRSPQLRALVGAKGDGARTGRGRPPRENLRAPRGRQSESAGTAPPAGRFRAELGRNAGAGADRRASSRGSPAPHSIRWKRRPEVAAPTSTPLAAAAAQIGPEAVRRARRHFARALHPDLFTQDPAAALLATELLKMINSLAG